MHAGADGLQVKSAQRPRGSLLEAQEFLRSQGLEDTPDIREIALRADSASGGFEIAFA